MRCRLSGEGAAGGLATGHGTPDLYSAPMALENPIYRPGQRVRVIQQIPRQSGTMTTTVEGTVLKYYTGKTGSWFAHSKDHKLWLDRLDLRLDNGELATVNLDQYTQVSVIGEVAPSA